jgi:hypothetical protein
LEEPKNEVQEFDHFLKNFRFNCSYGQYKAFKNCARKNQRSQKKELLGNEVAAAVLSESQQTIDKVS